MTDAGTVVIDASAMVDLLLNTEASASVRAAIDGKVLAAPTHFDAEVVSAIARLARAGALTDAAAGDRITLLVEAPIERAPLPPLLAGAWARRGDTRLADALYLELAAALGTIVVTTDQRLARAHPTITHAPGTGT